MAPLKCPSKAMSTCTQTFLKTQLFLYILDKLLQDEDIPGEAICLDGQKQRIFGNHDTDNHVRFLSGSYQSLHFLT